MKQYGDKLDFNKDTAFLFTDKNYLLISAHLKSKKEIYLKQAKEMFDTLRQIRTDHPLLKIVLGMDSNHFVDATLLYNEQEQQLFFMVPTLPEKPTTVKKRSFMQAQYSKAGVEVSEVKDHVACSREIV
jgi:UDP-N-acetylglucosamine 2-epimerase